VTKDDLLRERLGLVAQLHSIQATIDAVLDRITVEPKRKPAPAKSKKKGK
jgi:hypothetical protein